MGDWTVQYFIQGAEQPRGIQCMYPGATCMQVLAGSSSGQKGE